jgi:hypothetical protein
MSACFPSWRSAVEHRFKFLRGDNAINLRFIMYAEFTRRHSGNLSDCLAVSA